MRFLILDDDDDRHDIWHALFTKAGHEVVHTHTIEEFLRVVNDGRYDIIFLDHDLNMYQYDSTMAGMYGPIELNGVDACKIVAQIPPDRLPGRIIIHSWNDDGAANMWEELRNHPHLTDIPIILNKFSLMLTKRHALARIAELRGGRFAEILTIKKVG